MESDLDLSCLGVPCIFECVVDEIEYQLCDGVTVELDRRKSFVQAMT